jgi:polysaccharide export outer membrane protein
MAGCRSYKDLAYLSSINITRLPAETPGWPFSDSLGFMPPFAAQLPYRIHPGDNLFVNITSGNAELDALYNPTHAGTPNSGNPTNLWTSQSGQYMFGYLVNSGGDIILPSFGAIHVAGLNQQECENTIRIRAFQYFKEVTVRVRLLNFRVTVLGEVMSPGLFYNYNPSITIFDAIGLANGAKNTAALDHVLVVRKDGNHNRIIEVNLHDAAVLKSEAYFVRPNDVIIVQPARFKNAELKLPVISIIASSVTTLLLVLNFIANAY